jgi:hypothetical protein
MATEPDKAQKKPGALSKLKDALLQLEQANSW